MYWNGYVMSVVEKKINASLIHWKFVCVGLHIRTSRLERGQERKKENDGRK